MRTHTHAAADYAILIPYCPNTSDLTGAGLLNRASVPAPVFGKAMTSRIEVVSQRMVIKRSKPLKNRK
jgi:hypothetical protein